jgi:hypothetical protein
VADVLATIVPRVTDRFARIDSEDDAADGWTEAAPVLAGLAAASVQGVAALGEAAGQRAQRFGRIVAAQRRHVSGAAGRVRSACRAARPRRSARAIGTCVSVCAAAARGAG